jgi:hypothetical protein
MVALWGRKLEDPSRLFLQRYETRSLYGASSRGIPVKKILDFQIFLKYFFSKNLPAHHRTGLRRNGTQPQVLLTAMRMLLSY